MRFPRGPHFVNCKLKVSESIAAFLHYKFYKGFGVNGIQRKTRTARGRREGL